LIMTTFLEMDRARVSKPGGSGRRRARGVAMARVLLQDAAMRRVAGMGRQAGLCIKELLMCVGG
jgi:hypothetical protein